MSVLTMDKLYEEIKEELISSFGVPPEGLSFGARLVDDLDLDSIDMVDLLSTASGRFSVDLNLRDFEGVLTLQDFLSRLLELLNQKRPRSS